MIAFGVYQTPGQTSRATFAMPLVGATGAKAGATLLESAYSVSEHSQKVLIDDFAGHYHFLAHSIDSQISPPGGIHIRKVESNGDIAAIERGDDRRSGLADPRADDGAPLLFDAAAAGGARADQASGAGVGREGSSAGTPILSRKEGEAGGAAMNAPTSTLARDQASPSHSRNSAPPPGFGAILTAAPSSRLGVKAQSGRLVMHASDDLEAIYRALGAAKTSIEQDLRALAQTIDGVEFYGARLKERRRVEEKLTRRAAGEIGDLLGVRMIADSDAAIDDLIEGLRRGGVKLFEIDDFREQPKGPGYRAVHVQIAAGEVSFELQIQPRPVRDVQGKAHKIYERYLVARRQ